MSIDDREAWPGKCSESVNYHSPPNSKGHCDWCGKSIGGRARAKPYTVFVSLDDTIQDRFRNERHPGSGFLMAPDEYCPGCRQTTENCEC